MPELKIGNLFARRSTRKYTDAPVSDEQVELLLQAAMAGPSAGNRKPWHFIVVTDAGLRQQLADSHANGKMLVESPVVLVPCGDPALSIAGRPDYWVQDLSAATENILLAATAIGLGTVWCGVHPVPERVEAAREILGIPEEIVPFAYIAVGHPAEEKEPRTQYDAERVHRGRW